MNLLLTGLNHKTAPVSIREIVAFGLDGLPGAFQIFRAIPEIRETLILSTCNRTEIYAVTQSAHVNGLIPECLSHYHNISPDAFKNHLYVKEGREAARHLFSVASGLDSLVLGENQILSQVKTYFKAAQDAKSLGMILHRLTRASIETGKRIRHETAIGENPGSVGEAALDLAETVFGSLKERKVLVLGAGEMGRLVFETLATSGVSNPTIVSRHLQNAKEFAERIHGTASSFDDLDSGLESADIVITAAGGSLPVLTREKLEAVMHKRRAAPLFIIDIAVPRNVEESAGTLENLYLYNVDDLEGVVQSARGPLQKEIAKAEAILEEELSKFDMWLKSLEVTPTIRALTDKVEEIKAGELEKILSKFPHLNERERAAVETLAHTLANKILHQPLVQLKAYANDPKGLDYIEIVRNLFGLENRHE